MKILPYVNRINSTNNKIPNFRSAYGTYAYGVERELLEKGIKAEFRNNMLVASCTKRTIEIFEKLFGHKLVSKNINFAPIEADIFGNESYGVCYFEDSSVVINSSLRCFDSKHALGEEMKMSKNIFFLPNEKSTTHYMSTFIHEMGHAVHFSHLRDNHQGFMIPRLQEAKIPSAIGRLITKFKLGKYAATNLNEFMAERITKDIASNLNSEDVFVGDIKDVNYSDIFARKWNCRYICPQAYLDYYTQQIWGADINEADKVVKMIEEYLVQVETAEKPETVPVPEPVVTLKTIERPKEEAKVKQDTLLGKIDAFFGRNLSTPRIIDEKNDIKMKLKL